jgi:hypothetical protein
MNKTMKVLALMASLVLMGVSAPVMAQTAAATPAATAAPTVAAPVVKVDGLVDAFYSYNFGANSSKPVGSLTNVGYNYNGLSNSYQIGLAETKFTATQGAATGVVELAYEDTNYMAIPGAGAGPGLGVLQAYAQYTTGAWTLTGGRFVTWMGNEVVEAPSNFNYSHSLLFQYTIPVWNQGVNVSLAIDPTLSITGYATNGWNNVANTANYTAQTWGAEIAWTPNSTWKFILNGIDGPNTTGLNLKPAGPLTTDPYDYAVGELIVSYAAASDLSLALDGEYGGLDAGATFTEPGTLNTGTYSSATFWGVDLYGKWQATSDFSAALRLEYVSDPLNVLGLYGNTNGFGGDQVGAHEGTLTFTKAFTPAWTVSLEGRYDYETDGVKGGTTVAQHPFANGNGQQGTATLSTAFVF